MKKLMMMAAVAVAASFASAAQIQWKNNGTAFTDADGNALSNNKILLIQVAKGGDAPTISWKDGGLTISGGNYLGQTALGSDGKVATTVISITGDWNDGDINVYGGAAFGQPAKVAATGSGTANYKDYYMVVFDSATITADSKFAMTSVTNKGASSATGSATLSFAGTQFTEWANVPEPCTVALLALGMGALALRRKQR